MKNNVFFNLNAAGFWVGRTVSILLSVGHKIFGRVLDRLTSSWLQRMAFMAFARLNPWAGLIVCAAGTGTFAVLNPASTMTPASMLATLLLLLNCVPVGSMYYRLSRGSAAMLVTSCYGRQLRVHLPKANLEVGDAAEFRAQLKRLVEIGHWCHAREIYFRSPLLAAESKSALLARQLTSTARSLQLNVRVTVGGPEEVSAVSSGTLSVFSRKYADLRGGRLAHGGNGRLMCRKVQLHFL